MTDSNPAGWQADPTGRHEHRYWDGTTWTDNVSDAGVAGTDPFDAPPAPPADATVADAPAAPAAPLSPPTDTTAAWSTAAAPAAPTGGGGSSKKGLLIGGGILALIAIVVAVLLLGGGDDDETDEVRADLIGALTNPDQGGLSQDDAECVADRVIDDVDLDVLQGVDYSSDDPPTALQAAILSAYEACDVDLGGGSTDDSDDTTTTQGNDEETTTTESGSDDGSIDGLPEDYLDQLAELYEGMGLTSDQAECLAERIGEDIQSGDLTEEQAVTDIFGYLADCDISMSDLGAN